VLARAAEVEAELDEERGGVADQFLVARNGKDSFCVP
jgi:hypothetical protein